MSPRELLADLTRQGFAFVDLGDHLRVLSPAGRLTPELRATLLAHKPDILALLRGGDAERPRAQAPAASPGRAPLVCYVCRGRRVAGRADGLAVDGPPEAPAAATLVAAWLGEPAAEAVRA